MHACMMKGKTNKVGEARERIQITLLKGPVLVLVLV
jgi:hypothetical protein